MVAILSLVGLLGSGCISVASHDLEYTPEKLTRPTTPGPVLVYQLRCANPKLCIAAEIELRSVAQRSGLFSSVGTGVGGEGVQVSLDLANDGTLGLALITGLFSGLTLTVLPGYARDDFTLTAQVTRGANVKQYKYETSLSTWIQMFLVFGMFTHSPRKQQQKMFEDMFAHLLSDMQRDGLLSGQPAPAVAPVPPQPVAPVPPQPVAPVPAAPAPTPAAPGGCTKDSECKGNRICDRGVCRNPS